MLVQPDRESELRDARADPVQYAVPAAVVHEQVTGVQDQLDRDILHHANVGGRLTHGGAVGLVQQHDDLDIQR